jgi:hypothetical protein
VTHTIINVLGVIGLVIGIAETQQESVFQNSISAEKFSNKFL